MEINLKDLNGKISNLKGFNLCYMYKYNKIKYSQNLVVYLVTKLYIRKKLIANENAFLKCTDYNRSYGANIIHQN